MKQGLWSAKHGKIIIDWPEGIPVHFSPNITKLVLYHAKRSAEKGEAQANRDGRTRPYRYLRLYRRGAEKKIRLLAKQTLNERDYRIFHNSLSRPRNVVKLSEVDIALCVLSDAGKLAGCTQEKARKCIQSYLRKHGFGSTYTVTMASYRKRVKRLIERIGTKLQFM